MRHYPAAMDRCMHNYAIDNFIGPKAYQTEVLHYPAVMDRCMRNYAIDNFIRPTAYQTEVLRSSAALSRCNGQMHTQLLYTKATGLTACRTDLMRQKTNNAALSSCSGQMHAQLRYRQFYRAQSLPD